MPNKCSLSVRVIVCSLGHTVTKLQQNENIFPGKIKTIPPRISVCCFNVGQIIGSGSKEIRSKCSHKNARIYEL